jgi:hypothetical protein
LRRQELFDEIFGQQRFGGRRQYRFGRNPYNRRQFQSQYEQDEENQYENEFEAQQYYGQGEKKQVKANRAFAFALKHNPSNQIVLVGRVVDATQKPKQHSITSIYGQRQQGQQTLNGVDQQ